MWFGFQCVLGTCLSHWHPAAASQGREVVNSQAALRHGAKLAVLEEEQLRSAGKVPLSSQAAAAGDCSQVEEVVKENISEF